MRLLNDHDLNAVAGGARERPDGGTCTEPKLPPNSGLPGKWPSLGGAGSNEAR
jgi:hypothetical protein